MRVLLSLLVQNPHFSLLVPELTCLKQLKLKGWNIFLELVVKCKAYPKINTGYLLEQYRDTNLIKTLEILAQWNHMIDDAHLEKTFQDLLTSIYELILEHRQATLIALDRTQGLSIKEKHELWYLNQSLAKK